MSQFIETIKCKDGELHNLRFHQNRFDLARKNYFGLNDPISLQDVIIVPNVCSQGLYRCRVTYSRLIEKIEFVPHQIRNVKSLKLVYDNEIEYGFKYSNRERLTALFEQRGKCDDILIIKNNLVTDSFTANPIFSDGKIWWAPETYLLRGTQREKLISEGKIKVCKIVVDDISKYRSVGLINALQDFEEMPVIGIENIKF